MKHDIESEEDITKLVHVFYSKLLNDDLMSPHFKGLNLEHHFPRIIDFWSLILLDKIGYTSNVFDKHVHLNIHQLHFDKWVALFTETVDELFVGEKSNFAKQRAAVLGYTFGSKIEALNK